MTTKKKLRTPEKNTVLIDGTLEPVAALRIEAHEKGTHAEPFNWIVTHKEAVRERLPCNNPACYGGGFSLGNLLRDMVRDRQAEYVGTGFCTGQEGDPEEALEPRPSCPTRFDIGINLRFR